MALWSRLPVRATRQKEALRLFTCSAAADGGALVVPLVGDYTNTSSRRTARDPSLSPPPQAACHPDAT
jgi:hypothetical protein